MRPAEVNKMCKQVTEPRADSEEGLHTSLAAEKLMLQVQTYWIINKHVFIINLLQYQQARRQVNNSDRLDHSLSKFAQGGSSTTETCYDTDVAVAAQSSPLELEVYHSSSRRRLLLIAIMWPTWLPQSQ